MVAYFRGYDKWISPSLSSVDDEIFIDEKEKGRINSDKSINGFMRPFLYTIKQWSFRRKSFGFD